MENGESTNASQAQHNFTMAIVNEREQSHEDIMTRRMKNRERQRRYRARKRLEADSMKSSVIRQSTSLIMDQQPITSISNSGDQQPIAVVSNSSARVHSRRDWKKDARRAHVLKGSEVFPNGIIVTIPVSSSESQTLGLSSVTKGESERSNVSLDLVNYAPHGTTSGRRDWKAEARKRKT